MQGHILDSCRSVKVLRLQGAKLGAKGYCISNERRCIKGGTRKDKMRKEEDTGRNEEKQEKL